ncbi:hypothetical protein BY996DRAFT_4583345 [Phakopsora pachyrhizi]|nr:hypothetical protein BY996DRAFT_4583345 [Phakopsora pachyrhizi]
MDPKGLPPAIRPEFCSHAARVLSYKTKKSTPKSSRWPHPESFNLKPEILSQAGYFHDPIDGEPDRTTCWMCGESMKGWAKEDDPWALHCKWSPDCPFGRLSLLEHQRDTQNRSWSDSPHQTWGNSNEWFPRGQRMIEARLATFCGPLGPWKHEGENGVPTRLELARAGFHFTPNLFKKGRKYDVDDTTSCCYCNRVVTEWEPEDDPVSVHLKKGPCIFFSAAPPLDQEQPVKTKAPSRKTSRAAKPPGAYPGDSTVVDNSVQEIEGYSEIQGNDKSIRRPKKASSVSTQFGKKPTVRRANTTTDESESEEVLQPRPRRVVSKTTTFTELNSSPPGSVDHQLAKKPPVALSNPSRLSRSTSKQSLNASSGRSVSMNQSSSGYGRTVDASNQPLNDVSNEMFTADEETQDLEEFKPQVKNTEQRQKPTKTLNQLPSSAVLNVNLKRSNEGAKDKPKTKVFSNTKSEVSAEMPVERSAALKNVSSLDIANLSGSGGVISAQTIFVGFNPQAPQLYPGRLPIAAKTLNPFIRPEAKAQALVAHSRDQKELPSGEADAEAAIDEYFSQDPVPVPAGWLPNPYNPARPFPPLTDEECRMPLVEYFAYRAQQEEDAFLQWVEEKRMKPWLEAVENGRKLVEDMIGLKRNQGNETRFENVDVYVSPVKSRAQTKKKPSFRP